MVSHCKTLAEGGEPFVVFAYHREVIDGICKGLDNGGIGFTSITGGNSATERQRSIDSFQGGEVQVFVGQLQAAGVGINLTRASTVIIAEPSYVPAELSQAIDRLHRIGQRNVVNVQFLVARNSFDQRVTGVLQSKIRVLAEMDR
jgi:SWI/SNF-related matrix-associated actin-dependent regulator 1 of chromatin subfamily A